MRWFAFDLQETLQKDIRIAKEALRVVCVTS
jgi:hypothetical protein